MDISDDIVEEITPDQPQENNLRIINNNNESFIFPCAICWQRFQYPWQVGRHVEAAHLRDSPSMCQSCGKMFQTKHGLRKHERTHTGQKPYKCAYCFKTFAQWSQWKSHEETHSTSNTFQCGVCNVFFKFQVDLEEHCQSGICTKDPAIECCGKSFSREEFIDHQKKKHRRVQKKRLIPCNLCEAVFETVKDAIAHEKQEHNITRSLTTGSTTEKHLVECPHCNRKMVKAGLANHVKSCAATDGGKTFRCRRCNIVFEDKRLYDKHKLEHLGSRFACEYCPKSFKWKNLLIQHIRTHSGEKPLLCKFCNKGFAHPSTLYAHLRGHTGVKPFSCKFCELKFTRYGTWQSHTRTHTGEKPYPCEVCGKCFAQRSTLTSHIKTHENRTGERKRKGNTNVITDDLQQQNQDNHAATAVYFTNWDL